MRKLWCWGAALGSALAAAAAPGNMIGVMSQNEGFSAVPAPKPVKVDGDLGEWDRSGEIWSFTDIEVRDQFSVKTSAMWTPEALYLAFVWKDPMPLNSTVNPDFDASRGWVADAVQLRVVAGNQPSWITAWCFDGNRANFDILYWDRPDRYVKGVDHRLIKGKPGNPVLGDGIESAYKMLPDKSGFVHELRIPWKLLYKRDHTPKAGEKIQVGMEFMWGDVTGNEWPVHRFADNMAKNQTSRQFFWTALRAWGDLELTGAPVKEKRTYRAGTIKLEGSIPVMAEIPAADSTFTVVIEDRDGNRIRNLAGGFPAEDFSVAVKNGKRTVRVMWDGLSDTGKLVKPGTYKVRGLTHKGLSANYVMSFYNPGTPVWSTPDGKGAWGSDHSRPEHLARSGNNMIVACDFVEGGHGIWAIGPDGKKLWSEKRGVTKLAANAQYVYGIPNFWDTKEPTLYRYSAPDGKYAPFVLNGKERPFNLSFREILNNQNPPEVVALAAGPVDVAVGLADGKIALVNGETGVLRKMFPAGLGFVTLENVELVNGGRGDKRFCALAFDGKNVYYFRNKELVRLNVANGKIEPVKLSVPVEVPSSLALDDAGNIYISDIGKAMRVLKFSPDGKFSGAFGQPGGRPRMGQYQPDGMREMSAVAVGADGKVWTAEYTDFPRRVSVWDKSTGKLSREYVGNTGYSGTGAYLHDVDPGKAYVKANELTLDVKNRSWKMAGVVWNGDPARGESLSGPGGHDDGHVFYSNASGERREYLYKPHQLFLREGDAWRPVSGIVSIGNLQGLLGAHRVMVREASGQFKGLNPYDVAVWNDLNGDGYIQRSECVIVPAARPSTMGNRGEHGMPTIGGWGQRMDPADMTFFSSDDRGNRWKFVPEKFIKGAPVYSLQSVVKFPKMRRAECSDAIPVPGEPTVITFTPEFGSVILGMDKTTGKVKWTYPDPYDSVHGSHRAVMPRPGLVIGPLKVTGTVPGCGEAGTVFMMRGNSGQDFYLTTDGLYVDSMFRDQRLPRPSLPATEEQLRGMPFKMFSMGSEPFNGWIGRQSDGVVRMLCGIAGQASSLTEVKGLEAIRRFTAPEIRIDEAMLIAADAENGRRKLAAARIEPYGIVRATGAPKWNAVPAMKLEVPGQPLRGFCKLAWTPEALHAQFTVDDPNPWKNNGNDFTRLFKTGDCVDLCFSVTGNRKNDAREGDCRILIAPFKGKATAVLMRQVAAGAPAPRRYQSPVGTVEFAEVRQAPEVGVSVRPAGNRYTVEVRIPWSVLKVTPKAGLQIRGDAGFIASDENGEMNIARIYYANKDTNLVSDMPLEAKLFPGKWTTFTLK